MTPSSVSALAHAPPIIQVRRSRLQVCFLGMVTVGKYLKVSKRVLYTMSVICKKWGKQKKLDQLSWNRDIEVGFF